jgi:hypothetical protein
MPKSTFNPYQSPAIPASPKIHPGHDPRLNPVATGLKLIHIGILLSLIAGTVGFPSLALAGNSSLITFLIAILLVLGVISIQLGTLFCIAVPVGIGLRPSAIATVILQSAFVGLIVLEMAYWRAFPWYAIGSGIFALFASASFLIFMLRTSLYIQRDDLVRRTRNVVFIGLGVFAGTLAVAFLVETDDPSVSGLIGMVSCGFSYLVLFVAYANLVNALADAIRNPATKKKPVGLA